MRRELRVGVASLRRRPLVAVVGRSILAALPTAASGLVVAGALDHGFLAGRPEVGLASLGVLAALLVVARVGARGRVRRLGELAEVFRDELIRTVVGAALRRAIATQSEHRAPDRVTRLVEDVRDAYATTIVGLLGFAASFIGLLAGLLVLAPVAAPLVAVPLALGAVGIATTLGIVTAKERASVHADDQLTTAAVHVLAGVRDVVAAGAERHAAALLDRPIRHRATVAPAYARAALLRVAAVAVGGWLPPAAVLVAGPWLLNRGLSTGAFLGALTYALFAAQPALRVLASGVGEAWPRFVAGLVGILDAGAIEGEPVRRAAIAVGYDLSLTGVRFGYGPHAEPVLRGLDLSVPEGDYLAILGPSGAGKSTVVKLMCGLLSPSSGFVRLGGAPAADLPAERLAELRVLVPEDPYVFTGTVHENLTYLRPDATTAQLNHAVAALGAGPLVLRLGGYRGEVRPEDLTPGERQHLALVRAYVSAAPLIVLDEATSHLDPLTERIVEHAFATRVGTLIVVAHHISSALRAPRVLLLDGTTAMVGDHETLRITSPLYRDLVERGSAEAEPRRRGTSTGWGSLTSSQPRRVIA